MALSITASGFIPSPNAKIQQGIAGETITQGQTLYKKSSDNRLWLGDANSSAETALIVGLACNAASAGQPVDYVYEDDDLTVGATLVTTSVYVASATAGAIDAASAIVSGWYVTVLFVPKSTTKAVMKLTAGGTPATS
jgi:hypothetical protein